MKYIPSYLKMVLWIYPFLSAQTKTNRQIDISRAIAENIAHSAAWAVCNEMLSTKPTKQIKEFIETEICENELIQQSLDGAKGFHDYAYYRLIAFALRHKWVHLAYLLGVPYRWVFKIQYAGLKKN